MVTILTSTEISSILREFNPSVRFAEAITQESFDNLVDQFATSLKDNNHDFNETQFLEECGE